MTPRRPLAAFLLFAAAVLPQVLGLGAHALRHHEHEGEADGHGVEWSGLAQVLTHGHEHGEGVPDHEHNLLPSPPLRPEPPRDVPAPAIALEAPAADRLPLFMARPWWEPPRLSGASPPLLHLLCALLI